MAGLLLAGSAWGQIGVEQEVALGKRSAQNLEARLGLDCTPALSQRLNRVARKLVAVCGRDELTYRFQVLDTDSFNAMALPGGFVYVTRGALNKLPDGQLSFVIAHELTHITRRHSIHQMENEQWRRLGLAALLVGLGKGNLTQQTNQLAQLANQVISSRFSQADEGEADRLGTEMMVRAGVDPAYALLTLQTLARLRGGGMPQFVNAILGTHPMPSERIEAAYHYIPPLEFGAAQELSQAVAEASGLQPDSGLALELQNQNPAEAPTPLTSPAGESLAGLEKRLLSEELPRRLRERPGATRFGLQLSRQPDGSNLIRMKLH